MKAMYYVAPEHRNLPILIKNKAAPRPCTRDASGNARYLALQSLTPQLLRRGKRLSTKQKTFRHTDASATKTQAGSNRTMRSPAAEHHRAAKQHHSRHAMRPESLHAPKCALANYSCSGEGGVGCETRPTRKGARWRGPRAPREPPHIRTREEHALGYRRPS